MPHRSTSTTRGHGRRWRVGAALGAASALLLGGGLLAGVAGPAGASGATAAAVAAEDQEFRVGPDPTPQSVQSTQGPFDTERIVVPRGNGFGGGTIHYPTDADAERLGGIAVTPGFLSPQGTISWYGSMLASHGFVVITIDTNGPFDFPDSRSDQMMAALDFLTERSEVREMVDPDRLAVAGWSMGGGGSLLSAQEHPELQAAIGLTPWNLSSDWRDVTVPSLIIGAENDIIAPVFMHAEPFYTNLTSAQERAYVEFESADHFLPTRANPLLTQYVLSWAKRFVDNDTRYDRFLCPGPTPGPVVSEFRGTCPVD
ncbi:dienelactone hydrolase family protein [Streptomyces sp. DSM 44917]|uniref:Dienelactone hydrolase family protein n=1 Tax=Streptomyces boetiae TaxID=3075541 RepID=A0ABU2LAM8_9ACTN|nr:dienelactone hydrolase family protein [Streptomyces sp. DSM 44917]MDT0308338.1 dienelactone hydrolase family protein [Streptomyces sp. DSM 44917]